MKKIVFALLVMFSLPAFSQRVDKPGEPYEYFCQLTIMPPNDVLLTLPNEKGKKEVAIRDEDGKKLGFRNGIDAINYFTKRGWVYVDKYNNFIFIIKKVVTKDEQLFEYLNIDKKKSED